MLVQFSVENFRSICDRVTLDMTPAKSRSKKDHVIRDDSGKKTEVLPVGIIYGANAAGKSNILKAIRFAQRFILAGAKPDEALEIVPYKLDAEYGEKPSVFEFVFKAGGVVYKYGFAITQKEVVEEWLYGYNPRQYNIFERDRKENIKFGSKVKNQRNLKESVFKFTISNKLFLTKAHENGVDIIAPVMTWFRHQLCVITPSDLRQDLVNMALKDKGFLKFLSFLMTQIDTGISQVVVNKSSSVLHQSALTTEKFLQDVLQMAPDNTQNVDISLRSIENKFFRTFHKTGDGKYAYEIATKHLNSLGQEITFSPLDESDGTQKMMHFSTIFYELLTGRRITYFIDEFENSLHPMLCWLFVNTFIQLVAEESHVGQLIVTTHNTNLLDLKNLRHDEIWFVEKDKVGASHLISLVEYKQRNPKLSVEKRYLQGRYGAIPMLREIEFSGNE